MKRFLLGVVVLAALAGCGAYHSSPEPQVGPVVPVIEGEVCAAGRNAFQQSVYRLTRDRCTRCHLDGVQPPFASAKVEEAYRSVRRLTDFHAIEKSRFVTVGGNRHCAVHGYDCGVETSQVRAAVEQWWKQGERFCEAGTKYLTHAVRNLSSVPVTPLGTTLRFALSSARADLGDAELLVEASRLGSSPNDAYLLRRPRVRSTKATVYAKGFRLLVNDQVPTQPTAFDKLETTQPPGSDAPILSAQTVLLIASSPTSDGLRFAFEDLRPMTPETATRCRVPELFESTAARVFERRECLDCHGTADDPGARSWRFASARADWCAQALRRTTATGGYLSPLLALPMLGTLGHPRVLLDPAEIEEQIVRWLIAEGRSFDR